MKLITPDGSVPSSPVEPRNDWCVLEVIPDNITPGGLHKPENAYQELPRCRVLAVGPGSLQENGQRRKIDLFKGDVVHLFGHCVAIEAPERGRNGIVMAQECNIICVKERAPVN